MSTIAAIMISCADCGKRMQLRNYERHKLTSEHLFYMQLKHKKMGDGVDSDINAVSANNVCIPVTLLCVYT